MIDQAHRAIYAGGTSTHFHDQEMTASKCHRWQRCQIHQEDLCTCRGRGGVSLEENLRVSLY
jgi:hypothetical protein